MQTNTPMTPPQAQGNYAQQLATFKQQNPNTELGNLLNSSVRDQSSAPATFDRLFGIGTDANANNSVNKLLTNGSWGMNDTQAFFNIFNPMATSLSNPLANLGMTPAGQGAPGLPGNPSAGMMSPMQTPMQAPMQAPTTPSILPYGNLISQLTSPIPAIPNSGTVDPMAAITGMQPFMGTPQPGMTPAPVPGAANPMGQNPTGLFGTLGQTVPPNGNGLTQSGQNPLMGDVNGLADNIATEVQASKNKLNPLELAQKVMRGEDVSEQAAMAASYTDTFSDLKGAVPQGLMGDIQKEIAAKREKDASLDKQFGSSGNAELDARSDALKKLAGTDEKLAGSIYKDLQGLAKKDKLGELTQAPPSQESGTSPLAGEGALSGSLGGSTSTGALGTDGSSLSGNSLSGSTLGGTEGGLTSSASLGATKLPSIADTRKEIEASVAEARKTKDAAATATEAPAETEAPKDEKKSKKKDKDDD
jgi:hypothetical protein